MSEVRRVAVQSPVTLAEEYRKMKAQRDELLAALESLEQAYVNKHSQQHRSACLLEAGAVIARAKS